MLPIHTIAAPEIRITFSPNMKASQRPVVTCSADAVPLFRQHWDENFYELREEVRMILLNTRGRVLGIFTLSVGGPTRTVLDETMVFLLAVRTPGTRSIILAHNHPGGDTKPSHQDIQTTIQIKAGAALLGLKLLDHYILTAESYLSMADEGLM